MGTQQHWLEVLHGWDRFQVVWWSSFNKKRYFVFEKYWGWGKSAKYCLKDTREMSRKKIKNFYKENK